MRLIKLLLSCCLIGEYHGAAAASAGEPEVGGRRGSAVAADGEFVFRGDLVDPKDFSQCKHPFYDGGDFWAFMSKKNLEVHFHPKTKRALNRFMDKLDIVGELCSPNASADNPELSHFLSKIRTIRGSMERSEEFFKTVTISELFLVEVCSLGAVSLKRLGRGSETLWQWLVADFHLPHKFFLIDESGESVVFSFKRLHEMVDEKKRLAQSCSSVPEARDLVLLANGIQGALLMTRPYTKEMPREEKIGFFREMDMLTREYFDFSKKVDEHVKKKSREAKKEALGAESKDSMFMSLCAEYGVKTDKKKPSSKVGARVSARVRALATGASFGAASPAMTATTSPSIPASVATNASSGVEDDAGFSDALPALPASPAMTATTSPSMPASVATNASSGVEDDAGFSDALLALPASPAAASRAMSAGDCYQRRLAETIRDISNHTSKRMGGLERLLDLKELTDPQEYYQGIAKNGTQPTYSGMKKALEAYNVKVIRSKKADHFWYRRDGKLSRVIIDRSHASQAEKGIAAGWHKITKRGFDKIFGRR